MTSLESVPRVELMSLHTKAEDIAVVVAEVSVEVDAILKGQATVYNGSLEVSRMVEDARKV